MRPKAPGDRAPGKVVGPVYHLAERWIEPVSQILVGNPCSTELRLEVKQERPRLRQRIGRHRHRAIVQDDGVADALEEDIVRFLVLNSVLSFVLSSVLNLVLSVVRA